MLADLDTKEKKALDGENNDKDEGLVEREFLWT